MPMTTINAWRIYDILGKEFPELGVDSTDIYGDIKQSELTEVIRYIRTMKLFQDAISLIPDSEPLRNSVTYPVIFPDQVRELSFRVDWVQGPMVYVGRIQSQDHSGEEITQARMYGMRLK